MEVLAVLLCLLILAFFVVSLVFSQRAKRQDFYRVVIPEGSNVQSVVDAALRDLPAGWSELGSKKSHAFALSAWDPDTNGGNLLNIATGSGSLGTLYVISVEMGVTEKDDYGRPVHTGYDEIPPQREYEGHTWVSYAARGQGRGWFLPTTTKILKARAFLEERLGS